jgi:hypothetical protein
VNEANEVNEVAAEKGRSMFAEDESLGRSPREGLRV